MPETGLFYLGVPYVTQGGNYTNVGNEIYVWNDMYAQFEYFQLLNTSDGSFEMSHFNYNYTTYIFICSYEGTVDSVLKTCKHTHTHNTHMHIHIHTYTHVNTQQTTHRR